MSNILALSASYRADSLNRQLLALAITLAKNDGAQVTVLDYEKLEAPIYRGEQAVDALPPSIDALSDALRLHDGILLAVPEYNWSIPGGLKNIIDWLSVDSRAPLNGKTALLMCASPSVRGGISGLQHLRVPLELLGMWVYPQMIGIGRAEEQLQGERLAREADQVHLSYCVTDFLRATKALVRNV
jgi:chromate reductase